MQASRQERKKYLSSQYSLPSKDSFQKRWKSKIFSDKQKLRRFITSKLYKEELVKKVFQAERNLYLHKEIKSAGNGINVSKHKIQFKKFNYSKRLLSKAKIVSVYYVYNTCKNKMYSTKMGGRNWEYTIVRSLYYMKQYNIT